jgi:trimethylamine--corrinoid protein Co-methyltransferase
MASWSAFPLGKDLMQHRHHGPRNIAPGGLATHAYRPLSDSDIRQIHEASLTVLEHTGVQVMESEAREIFAQAGAILDGDRARLTRSMVEDALARAASSFILAGRHPDHDLEMSGERVHMGTGGAAIRLIDLDGQVREPRLDDIVQIGRLVDALDNIHFYLRPVVAHDVPKHLLDVNTAYAALTSTTKHIMTSAYTVPSARDVIEMIAMVMGSKEAYEARPIVSFVASWLISPLRHAPETVEVLIELVRQNVPVAISSAPQSGATAPAALAGTLTQINAEELSGIVLCNLVRPGARVLMGYVPSLADLRTGNYISGASEFALMNAAATQLAHFYGLPIYNSSGLTDSKIPDIQAGYEKGLSSATAALAGTNFIHHSAGFVENMLCVAYEQYVIDDDINGSVMRMARGIEVNDETLSVDLIDEVCRGEGHYLGTQQSLDLMRTEYYYPHTADRKGRHAWEADGALDMRERARRRAREILATHAAPGLDPAVDRAIRERFEIQLAPELAGGS